MKSVTIANPPYPIPPEYREKIHAFVDGLLDMYEWGTENGVMSYFAWKSPESSGQVRVVVEPQRPL